MAGETAVPTDGAVAGFITANGLAPPAPEADAQAVITAVLHAVRAFAQGGLRLH